MASSLAQKLTDLTRKYGIAWVIINQTLGWITYIMIWIVLERTESDVVGWLLKYKITRAIVGNLSKSAGNLAIAFAINRLGTPFRVFLTTWMMPYTAPFINSIVNPWLLKFGIKMAYGPGVPEPGEVDPQDMDEFPGVEGDTFDPALKKKESKKIK